MFSFVYKSLDFAHKLDKASEPTEDYGKHLHYFNEIIFFVKGDVEYTVEAETRRLSEGDIVLIQSGKYHFATVNSDVDYERYVFKFPNEILPDYLLENIKEFTPFFTNTIRFSMNFSQFETYFGKFSDEELHTLFACDLLKILIMLCRQPAGYSLNQSDGIVKRIINYIDENISSPLSLESLSLHFNYSKSYLSNEFCKYMKIPIMRYIRAKKIIAAHEMILSGEKRSTVAEKMGFENYSTFYRTYTKFLEESLYPANNKTAP